MVLGALTLNIMFYPLVIMALVVVIFLFATVEPYKNHLGHRSNMNAVFVLLLALLAASHIGFEVAEIKQPSLILPFLISGLLINALTLLYISIIIVRSQRQLGMLFLLRFCTWRHGYGTLN